MIRCHAPVGVLGDDHCADDLDPLADKDMVDDLAGGWQRIVSVEGGWCQAFRQRPCTFGSRHNPCAFDHLCDCR
ncbi:MAG: hypothetical protein CVT87_05645, partial [Alphaproteobacteria bacterium HGW-Alphaproteobacteria-9]